MDAAPDPRIPVADRATVQGWLQPPLLDQTVTETLARAAERWPDREYAVFPEAGQRWTYGAFAAAVDRLATGLLELGLNPGDRIGIWSPNRPEWLLVQFASARAGLVLVTVNPAYQADELRHALNLVGMRALVLARQNRGTDFAGIVLSLVPGLGDSPGVRSEPPALPDLEFVIHLEEPGEAGMLRFDDLAAAPADGARLERLAAAQVPSDSINIQFTSGTTGRPKGATLSHHNIVNNARQTAAVLDLGPEDRICVPVPLYHCFGMVMGSLAAATAGSCLVFPGERFDADAVLDAVEGERCTVLYGVPTMYVAMLEHPSRPGRNLDRLRT
ncbi:MAG: AMP-binding protein, partial [Rhodospirillales bacterium]|nr:AMP-binding protein [Rhodospirillales bacterium]